MPLTPEQEAFALAIAKKVSGGIVVTAPRGLGKLGWVPCPACNGTGAEFPGNPRTEKCEECDGTGRKRP